MYRGLQGQTVAGIVSEAGHYSTATLAGWLGIGIENPYSIPTDCKVSMRLDALETKLDELYATQTPVAFVMATFGTTDAFGIDDIKAIRELIDRKAAQYSAIVPQLHVDAAVGWVSCFLTEYNIAENPLGIAPQTLTLIEQTQRMTEGFRYADSVTIDFHKMGWGHYPSSAFIVNRREDLALLTRTLDDVPYFAEADFRHDPALFTLAMTPSSTESSPASKTWRKSGLRQADAGARQRITRQRCTVNLRPNRQASLVVAAFMRPLQRITGMAPMNRGTKSTHLRDGNWTLAEWRVKGI
ncbi:MAG: hypothetical protein A2V70_03305 [Planctomycetes bacterium RBG_13_63_9]|nr:MAG: hypothetical protein A2V70_03305 [Planctomycetes bacterium RBG_13_63_9]